MTSLFGEVLAASAPSRLDAMGRALAEPVRLLQVALGDGFRLAGPDVVRDGPRALARSGPGPAGTSPAAMLAALSSSLRAAASWDGAFAVAQVDAERRTVTLVRDPTGQRVLYWARLPGGVAFASRTRQLLARGDVDVALDHASWVRFLTFSYVPGDRSFARGVREVAPGTAVVLSWEGEVLREERLYEPVEPEGLEDRDPGDLVPRLRETLAAEVRRTLRGTEGPLCAFLSGGIDSSAVAALAHAEGERFPCYSIAFGDELPNELPYSAMVAERLGLPQRVLHVSAKDMADRLDETVFLLDDPIGDPLTVPNRLLAARAASDGFVRALNGEGGDPNFGGPKNIPMLLADWYGDGTPEARIGAYMSAYRKLHDDLPSLVLPDVLARATSDEPVDAPLRAYFEGGMRSFLNTLQLVNLRLKGGHLILPKVEKMYGAAGLVPLQPLFERAVVDVAFEIPPSGKLRGNVEKWALKEAVRDLVPEPVVLRKKRGMGVPVHTWLAGVLAPLVEERLGDDAQTRRGLYRREAMAKLRRYRGANRTKGNYGQKLWLLLIAETWMRLFLDGEARRFHRDGPVLVEV